MGPTPMSVHTATGRESNSTIQKASVTTSTSQMLGHSKAASRVIPGHLDLSQKGVPKDTIVKCFKNFRIMC